MNVHPSRRYNFQVFDLDEPRRWKFGWYALLVVVRRKVCGESSCRELHVHIIGALRLPFCDFDVHQLTCAFRSVVGFFEISIVSTARNRAYCRHGATNSIPTLSYTTNSRKPYNIYMHSALSMQSMMELYTSAAAVSIESIDLVLSP